MKNIYWLTGLPCSGKTTIAKELGRHLYAEILDGDNLRDLVENKEFTKESRTRHMMYTAAMAHYLSKYIDVVVSLVSPIKEIREAIKNKYSNLLEVYVKCDLDICKLRDVKGMYDKAEKGEITNFTGVQEKYEEPLDPDIVVRSDESTIDECVNQILKLHNNTPKALLIGRWQPLHAGHKALFNKVRQEGKKILIGIRDTEISESNPYSVTDRIAMIKEQVPDAEVVVIPDITEVCYGRGVGYGIREIRLSADIEDISATKIRKGEL